MYSGCVGCTKWDAAVHVPHSHTHVWMVIFLFFCFSIGRIDSLSNIPLSLVGLSMIVFPLVLVPSHHCRCIMFYRILFVDQVKVLLFPSIFYQIICKWMCFGDEVWLVFLFWIILLVFDYFFRCYLFTHYFTVTHWFHLAGTCLIFPVFGLVLALGRWTVVLLSKISTISFRISLSLLPLRKPPLVLNYSALCLSLRILQWFDCLMMSLALYILLAKV